jgi:competence protein ComEC
MNPSIFTTVINSYLPEPQASLLNGIIFGVPLKTSAVFYQKIKMVGLLHLVVLSGTNITILAAIVSSLTRNFSKPISILITMLVIIIFIIFVGPQAPIIRAGFMGILTLVANIYGKKSWTLYSLFLSAIFIFAFWPEWIKTISFQLSFAATLGLILFGQTKINNSIWREFKTSIAAQVFTTPIIFIYFKQVSLISPVANVLVAFLISPLMILGFLTAILGKINYYLGVIPAYACYGVLTYLVFVIEALSKLPFVFLQF